jgi:hypothetical protein
MPHGCGAPAAEYRTPTGEEWEELLGHFERRRVELGDCGRAYGTSCIHEHAALTDLVSAFLQVMAGLSG